MKTFLPWLTVLAVIMLLTALRLRPLATAVAVGWLGYCVWTWIRGSRTERRGSEQRSHTEQRGSDRAW